MRTIAVAFETSPSERALITATLGGLARAVFLEEPGFLETLPAAEVLLVRGWRREFPPGTLAGMRRLELVQGLFTGVDHLPWDEIPATATVCGNAGAQADAVAEHALALLLAAAKRIAFHDAAVRAGRFPQDVRGRRIEGLTLGILGYGHIGQALAARAAPLGMRILALNRHGGGDGPVDRWFATSEWRELAAGSDILVCCLPLTKATRGRIGREFLAAMKVDALLVNVSRGRVVDEEALFAHLRDHPGFTAALDVWWHYPKAEGERPYHRPFHDLPNVIMTPHVAFAVPDNAERILAHALENVARHLRGEPVRNVAPREEYA
jgi:phosphoglycerate dehydrogenase-like enzyme